MTYVPDIAPPVPAHDGLCNDQHLAGGLIASTITGTPPSRRNGGSNPTAANLIVAPDTAATLTRGSRTNLVVIHELMQRDGSHQNGFGIREGGPAYTLEGRAHAQAIAFNNRVSAPVCAKWAKGTGGPSGDETQNLVEQHGVRQLTPRECERLQGFPDDYTLVPYKGKPAKDSPRYRAIGNSMAVTVMRWIGERIRIIEEGTAQ